MKFIIFLALIVIAIIALSIAFKKKEKPQDITKSKIRKDRGADMPQSERLSSTATSGDKSVEIKPHKIMSTKAIDPKTILGHIEYIEIGKNIYPAGVDQIDDDVRKNLESKVGLIPQIPSNSMRLMNLLLNPESNLKEIVSLVSIHPVFSAKILQTVNSVYFSLPQKITSIGRAITLLGYNNVRALVFHETLLNTMQKQEEYDAERYLKIWAHSAMVSACAGFMGKYIFGLSEYDLATSGLLHDIGKFYLTDIKDSIEIVSDVPPFIKEEHRFGVNHSVAGTYIANHWQLPELIVKGIEYHHHPSFFPPDAIPKGYLKECFVLCLADLVAKAMGYHSGEDRQIMPILPEYFEMFDIDNNLKGIITTELLKNVEKAKMTVASYIDNIS